MPGRWRTGATFQELLDHMDEFWRSPRGQRLKLPNRLLRQNCRRGWPISLAVSRSGRSLTTANRSQETSARTFLASTRRRVHDPLKSAARTAVCTGRQVAQSGRGDELPRRQSRRGGYIRRGRRRRIVGAAEACASRLCNSGVALYSFCASAAPDSRLSR